MNHRDDRSGRDPEPPGVEDVRMQNRRLRAEVERLTADLQTMTDAYAEISRVVGYRGTEEHSLADDVRTLCAEIERLNAERAGDQQRLFHYECEIARLAAQNTETAAFLDRLAAQMDIGASWQHSAADCRAMAAKLRGEKA